MQSRAVRLSLCALIFLSSGANQCILRATAGETKINAPAPVLILNISPLENPSGAAIPLQALNGPAISWSAATPLVPRIPFVSNTYKSFQAGAPVARTGLLPNSFLSPGSEALRASDQFGIGSADSKQAAPQSAMENLAQAEGRWRTVHADSHADEDSWNIGEPFDADLPQGPISKTPTVPAADGTPLDAMLIRPEGFSPEKRYPVIVYGYGGAYYQQVKNQWNVDFMPWHQMMAQRDFAVLVIDNRLSGAGRTDVMRRMHKKLGAMEVMDIRSGIKWLKEQSWIDAKRIGLWGWSFGGYMTILSMERLKDIRAGVAVAPVTDWHLSNAWYTESRLGLPRDNAEAYKKSSPVNYAKHLKGRLMIIQGLKDDNVHYSHTAHYVKALNDAGKSNYEQQIYDGQSHDISRPADEKNLFAAMTKFFIRNLRRPRRHGRHQLKEKK